MDADLRTKHQALLCFAALRQRAEPPQFASTFDGLSHPDIGDIKKFDLALGDQCLQLVIGGQGQLHALRVRPDQDVVRFEDQVDRIRLNVLLFFRSQGRRSLCCPLPIEVVDKIQPLPGMNSGCQRVERGMVGEQRSDPGQLSPLVIVRQRVRADQL